MRIQRVDLAPSQTNVCLNEGCELTAVGRARLNVESLCHGCATERRPDTSRILGVST